MRKAIGIFSVIFSAILLAVMLALFLYNANSTNVKGGIYVFNTIYESKDWKNMNHAQRAEALNIPEKTLKSLSAEGLIETLIRYPLRTDIFAYHTLEEGIQVVSVQFNGLKELLSRNDVAQILLDKYENINIDYAKEAETNAEGSEVPEDMVPYWRMTLVETLLFTTQVQEKMSEEQLVHLNVQILEKKHQIEQEGQSYGLLNRYQWILEINESQNIDLPSQQKEVLEKATQVYGNSN